MGVVFLAEDTVLRRQVALKVLLPALAESEVARQRFVREARAVAMVQHDHIVPIHHVAEEAGLPFLVMPYLKGRLLGQVLVPGQPVAYPHILQIGREVALALAAAHSHGLIHRDIKPGNLWLETVDGRPEAFRVRVLDFGLARPVEACEGLTQTGMIVGSPGYMAPEQVDGLELDARADLFSLGCVLYLLATGQPAFPGDTLTAKVKALATRDPEAPHLANAAVPRPLSALILHLLVKQRDGRPASAIEVVRRLEEIGRDPTPPAPTPPLRKPLTAPPTPAATAPRRSLQRRRAPAPKPRVAPAAVSQLLLALLVFGVLLALLLHRTFGPAGKGSGRALQNPPQVAPVPALPDPE
jgi:serine/threonine protein kinase